MPRPKTIQQSDVPYNIGGRCINREWFRLPMDDVWKIMSDQLYFIHHAFNVEILSFLLMSNHFHLIVRTPDSNISQAMAWFMRETSRSLTFAAGRINQGYGSRYFRSLLSTSHYYLHAYKYLYANPVKAKVVSRVEEYPYSSLQGLLGFRKLSFPVSEDLTLFSDVEGTIKWLNQQPKDEHWEAVRKALKRKEFKLSKVNRKPHPLELDAL